MGKSKSKKRRGRDGARPRVASADGKPTASAVERQLRAVAAQMGLGCDAQDASPSRSTSPEPETPTGSANIIDLGGGKSKKRRIASGADSWLLLQDGDEDEEDSTVSAWHGVAKLVRLVRAARLALGHPPGAPKDLSRCVSLVQLMAKQLPEVLKAKEVEASANPRACGEATSRAAAAADDLSQALQARQEAGDGLPRPAAEAWVYLVCALDEVYHHLYYACLAGQTSIRWNVPSPPEYLEAVVPPGGPAAAFKELQASNPTSAKGLRDASAVVWGKSVQWDSSGRPADDGEGPCDLQRVFAARCTEGMWLFLCSGLADTLQLNYKNKFKGKGPQRMDEPQAPKVLSTWRSNCRHWAARLYAFAVPSPEAIQELASHSPIIEVGAGTGYWASLLKQAGANVQAYDTAPTSQEQWNSYHGQVPPYTTVQHGGPDVLRRAPSGTCLFLCYPPPDSSMARKSLDAFKGRTVCHVGEWGGMTGTADFEQHLTQSFRLTKVVQLPNWGNTCYALTVWRRHSGTADVEDGGRQAALRCNQCSEAPGLEEGVRSGLCHQLVYCSQSCADRHAKQRQHVMTLNLLPVHHRPRHFFPLRAGAI